MPRERVGVPKPFAGESDDLKPSAQHDSTKGVIGFLGHLPGVQNAITVSFPTTAKQSKSYSDEMKRVVGDGGALSPARVNRDKWGNLAIPRFSSSLQAGQPAPAPTTAAGDGDARKSPGPGLCHSPPPGNEARGVLTGYMGHRHGVRANYGVTFSKEKVEAPRRKQQ
jgi:hypothetical protein